MAESAHFRVYGDEPAKTLTARATVLEDYRSLLVNMTSGLPPLEDAPRLDVFLLGSIADAAPFSRLERDVVGFYAAELGRISAFADTTESSQIILLHEYAHHYMLSSSFAAYPAWYVEGFAEYFSTAVFKPDKVQVGLASTPRATWLAYGTWLPMHKLLARDQPRRSGEDTAMYYAQSWLLTHYLFRTPGMTDKLQAYLKAVSKGADPVEAFKAEIDPDLNGFQKKLRSYLSGSKITYTTFKRPPPATVKVNLTTLTPAANPMLMQLVGLEYGVRPEKRDAAIAAVRKAAARTPGDPLAQRTLALLELLYGDRGKAIVQLDALIAQNPNDSTLLRWRARAASGDAGATPEGRAAARRLLVRAFNADAQDWRTLFAYVHLNDLTTGPLEKSVFDVMARTYELAPQVSDVVIAMAVATAQSGDLPGAARILEPLAYAPHAGHDVDLAKALRDRAVANDLVGMIALLRSAPREAG